MCHKQEWFQHILRTIQDMRSLLQTTALTFGLNSFCLLAKYNMNLILNDLTADRAQPTTNIYNSVRFIQTEPKLQHQSGSWESSMTQSLNTNSHTGSLNVSPSFVNIRWFYFKVLLVFFFLSRTYVTLDPTSVHSNRWTCVNICHFLQPLLFPGHVELVCISSSH